MDFGARHMTIDSTNYLDIGNLFFNEVIGDVMLGLIVGLLLTIIYAAKFKVQGEVTLALCLIWIAACFSYSYSLILFWMMIVLFVGAAFYFALSKTLER